MPRVPTFVSPSRPVAMSPEGTRKKTERWKSGFYWMACKGQVPIVIGFIDYRTKQVGLCGIFYPTGDIDADMPKIQAFYRGKTARYPQLFTLDQG